MSASSERVCDNPDHWRKGESSTGASTRRQKTAPTVVAMPRFRAETSTPGTSDTPRPSRTSAATAARPLLTPRAHPISTGVDPQPEPARGALLVADASHDPHAPPTNWAVGGGDDSVPERNFVYGAALALLQDGIASLQKAHKQQKGSSQAGPRLSGAEVLGETSRRGQREQSRSSAPKRNGLEPSGRAENRSWGVVAFAPEEAFVRTGRIRPGPRPTGRTARSVAALLLRGWGLSSCGVVSLLAPDGARPTEWAPAR